jgi:hypothetical protein
MASLMILNFCLVTSRRKDTERLLLICFNILYLKSKSPPECLCIGKWKHYSLYCVFASGKIILSENLVVLILLSHTRLCYQAGNQIRNFGLMQYTSELR